MNKYLKCFLITCFLLSIFSCKYFRNQVVFSDIPDTVPPFLKFYPGYKKNAASCDPEWKPTAGKDVSGILISYDFCVEDQYTSWSAGIDKLCLMKGEVANAPATNDKCWMKKEELKQTLLLKRGAGGTIGINKFTLFARDGAGNISRDYKAVNLHPADPPRIDILLPTNTDIANNVWDEGDTITLRWKITDDSDYEDIKIIITLVNDDDKTGEFLHLACNFSTNDAFTCPVSAEQNSRHIAAVGNDEGTYSLTIPTGWGPVDKDESGNDIPRRYTILITAIDKAGNAAVAGTQETNAGWEVLAGRTYKGIGGSGITIARKKQATRIRVDSFAQLYDSTNNVKLRMNDNRSCRMINNDGKETPFDCEDIIKTNYSIINRFWEYNPDKDVFYASTGNKIVEINFNNRTATAIFGGGSKPLVAGLKSVNPNDYKPILDRCNEDAADESEEVCKNQHGSCIWNEKSSYKCYSPKLKTRLSYDTTTKRLFFRFIGYLFTIDESGKLSYILGNGVEKKCETETDEFNDKEQKDLPLPPEDKPFVVTRDGQIVLGTGSIDDWKSCPSYGIQYLIKNFSLDDSTFKTSLEFISPKKCGNPKGDTWNEQTSHLDDMTYDPKTNTIYGDHSWKAISAMKLPVDKNTASIGPKEGEEDYKWRTLIVTKEWKENIRDKNPKIVGKDFHSGVAAHVPGTNILYVVNDFTGAIFEYDLNTNKAYPIIGFPSGIEGEQLGMNRYVDTPLHIAVLESTVNNEDEIFFNDTYNLQKVTMKDDDNVWSIETVFSEEFEGNFPQMPFKIDSKGEKLYQIHNYSGGAGLRIFPLNENSVGSPLGKYKKQHVGFRNNDDDDYTYQIQQGIGNNLVSPIKTAFLAGAHDGFEYQHIGTTLFKGEFIFDNIEITSLDITNLTNRYASNHCADYGPCIVGENQKVKDEYGNDLNYYKGTDYKMRARSGMYHWSTANTTAAFNKNDTELFVCVDDKFMLYSLTGDDEGKMYQFYANGLECKTQGSVFSFYDDDPTSVDSKGYIYFAKDKGVYRFNLDNVSSIKDYMYADFEKVKTDRPMLPGSYGGMFITDKYIYYTDKESDRLLRNKYSPAN